MYRRADENELPTKLGSVDMNHLKIVVYAERFMKRTS